MRPVGGHAAGIGGVVAINVATEHGDVGLSIPLLAADLAAVETAVERHAALEVKRGVLPGDLNFRQGQGVQRRTVQVVRMAGGLILSPVDNVREDTSHARDNVTVMIDEWRRLTGQ